MSIQTMRAIQVHDYGNVDQLKLEDVPRPVAQAGEVLVQVHAAGVNPIDWKVRQGLRKHILPMQFPSIPGMEMAGVVAEVGSGVTTVKIGQAVYGQSKKGAYAEYTVAAADQHPSKLDFLATVHPFELGCAQEIDRSLTQLGAKGLTLTSSYAGRWLDDSTLAPFWEYVQSRDVAIFLHPSISPTWLPDNDSYRMQEMVYRPFNVVTTVTRMVCSGLFDRYPQLKMVIPFTGAGLMDLLGRLDYFHQKGLITAPGKNAVTCQRLPSTYIETNVYTELAVTFSPTTIQKAIEVFGSDHVLFGTDTPVAATGEQLTIVKQLHLSPSVQEQILWKNSNELFHLNIQLNSVIPQSSRS